MKRINLPISKSFYSRVIDMSEVSKDLALGKKVSFGTIDFGDSGKDLDQARQNGGQVIWSAICLEKKLELILATFLFPMPDHQCGKEKAFFASQIIGADVLTYAAKKKLVVTIVNDQGLLKGRKKDQLSKVLKTVMDYRNAFAHGDISFHADTGCILKYWQGALKRDVLKDEYWEKLEEFFRVAHDLSDQVIRNLKSNIVDLEDRSIEKTNDDLSNQTGTDPNN